MKTIRTSPHVIETKSRDCIRSKINAFYENGDALFRELSERDYGIDAIVEMFENGIPSGKIAFIQIKGTNNAIQPLKNKNCVSCQISSSNLMYAKQTSIPVILVYVNVSKPDGFYYLALQNSIYKENLDKCNKQKSINVHIPLENNALDDFEGFFDIILSFYKPKDA